MNCSVESWNKWSRESWRLYKVLVTACSACVIIISTNLLVIKKFTIHLPTVVMGSLEIILILFILLTLIVAAILKRRDLLNIYMITVFMHSQYRVIVAVTASLIATYPQTYLFILSNRQYTSRLQVQIVWILVVIASTLAWIMQMTSVYFAMIYRSYLRRARRKHAVTEVVFKQKLIEPKNTKMEELQLSGIESKKLQPVCENKFQPVHEGKQ